MEVSQNAIDVSKELQIEYFRFEREEISFLPQKYKEFNMIEKCITTSIKIGGFGVGGVLGYTIDGGIATVAGISGFSGAVLSEILTYPKAQEAVNWVVEACLSHKNSKYMVNLWKCKKMIG